MAEYSRAQLEEAADKEARNFNIPPEIFRGLIAAESSWNPKAQAQGSTAYGLTQMVRGTAKQMGVTDITQVDQQLQGGAKYLALMKSKFGNWRDALAAYNQGPAGDLTKGAGYADKILKSASGNKNVSRDVPTYDAMGNQTGGESSDKESDYKSGGIKSYLEDKFTNVGFLILGAIVIGGAIFMMSPSKNIAVNLAKKAIG